MIDKNGLKSKISEYKNNVYEKQGFTKTQIKSDLKKIFNQFQVDTSNFLLVNIGIRSGISFSTYIDSITELIYKKELAKSQKTSENLNSNNKDAQTQQNEDESDKESTKNKHFFISTQELKTWSESAIKPNLINKMLQTGFSLEEINSPNSANFYNFSSNGTESALNITQNIPLIDRMVEFYKATKQALEKGQSLEDVINNKDNQEMSDDEQSKEDNEQENSQGQAPDDSNSEEKDSLSREEELEDVMELGR